MTAASPVGLRIGEAAPVASQRPEHPVSTAAIVRPRRIAIFGLFGCGNMGNDASLEAMLGFLREARPEAELICICDRPDIIGPRFDIDTVAISPSRHRTWPDGWLNRRLRKLAAKVAAVGTALRVVWSADVMVVPGTGILDDFGERPHGMPFDILVWCLAARLTGTRLALVSIGAGPIDHPTSRRLMRAAARLAHYRSYRDELSRSYMASIGFDTKGDAVYPDIVFRLDEPAAEATMPSSDPSRLCVGVGVMSYYGWYGFAEGGAAIFETYIGKISRFVAYLLDSGHSVRLLTGEAGDATAIDRVKARLATDRPDLASGRIIVEPIASLHDLMRQVALTDIVVATRFHNIVCALKMGKPTISLGYARKNDVLMAEMGLEGYCHHVERFEVDSLIDQFSELVATRAACGRTIVKRSADFKRQLARQDECLLSEVL